MRGVYESVFKVSGAAAAKTLFLLTAPAGKVCEILAADITNTSSLTNQQLEASFQFVQTIGSPTGTSITPSKMEQGDQAAGATVLGNLTAEPTTYLANGEFAHQGWPAQGSFQFAPQPEERPVVQAGASVGLLLKAGPSPAVDLVVRVRHREIG